jgi:hypothetical protein
MTKAFFDYLADIDNEDLYNLGIKIIKQINVQNIL